MQKIYKLEPPSHFMFCVIITAEFDLEGSVVNISGTPSVVSKVLAGVAI